MNGSAKLFAALPLAALISPALAHPGHLVEQAGHTHWLAFAAVGLALAVTIAGFVRFARRRRRASAHG